MCGWWRVATARPEARGTCPKKISNDHVRFLNCLHHERAAHLAYAFDLGEVVGVKMMVVVHAFGYDLEHEVKLA